MSTHQSGWLQVLRECIESDLSDVVYSFTDNTVTALAMAATGYGIALARSPVSDGLVKTHGLVPCLKDLKVTGLQHYYLFSPLAHPAKSAAISFRKWLLSEIT